MLTLNLIGCGRLGRSLARLWHRQACFHIGDILTRGSDSAEQATACIGAGRPVPSLSAMQPAGLWLIATPDDRIADSAAVLADSGLLRAGDTVFHCSGALPSSILAPVTRCGAQIASIHPLMSFADPESGTSDFAGTWCGIEGGEAATKRLGAAFEAIGGRLFPLDPAAKTLYHSATVMACNNLVALLEAALQLFEQAGVPRPTALKIIAPIVRGTVDNVLRMGTTEALTGPVARGDHQTVARQVAALETTEQSELYRHLGRICLALAEQKAEATKEDLARIRQLLKEDRGSIS